MENFRLPGELSLVGNVAENWRRWKQMFNLYLEASEKTSKTGKQKVSIMLNLIGENAVELFNTFEITDTQRDSLEAVIEKFDEYCNPAKNIVFERYNFFSAFKKENETVDTYVTELKRLAKSCEFGDQTESLIRDRIVFGINNKSLQERLLRESDLKLTKAIDMCRADEISKSQMKVMQKEDVCAVRKNIPKMSSNTNRNNVKGYKANPKQIKDAAMIGNKCKRCGKLHKYKECPAWGKTCSKCHKLNHFAKFCKSLNVKIVEETVTTENNMQDTVWSLVEYNQHEKVHGIEWRETIKVNGQNMSFKLDSGAEVNIVPHEKIKHLKNVKINPTCRKLTSYSGHSIKVKGICLLECETKTKNKVLEFFVSEDNLCPVLGLEALEKLYLVQRVNQLMDRTVTIDDTKQILYEFKDVFEGVGKLDITHSIKIKENSTPKVVAARKIPLSIRDKVKEELDIMMKNGIIEKIEEPTEWVHPIVIVQKPNGKVRICLDPRELNKVIQREHYQLPTQETIFSELKGSKIFSVLDASTAFWQIPLDEESSKLCTIATPFGRFKFKRLPYGLSSSSEVFQKAINNALAGIEGVNCYMDDILIYAEDLEKHNKILKTVLQRLRHHNMKLSKSKMQLAVNKVKYLGHIISKDGIAAQQDKIEAIRNLKKPENKVEVQRFLGMVTYLAKFIPNLSNKTNPLRKLLRKNKEWRWNTEEEECFQNLKTLIINAPVLAFYDPNKKTTLSTDASQYGLGAVLLQDNHPIAYASTSLTPTQQRYAQIEKEMLGLIFGCERFRYFLSGTEFVAETDHKPLLSIVNKPLENLSPRLQRMVLKLLRYSVTLKFVPGKDLYVADHLSRDPLKENINTDYLEGQTGTVHMVLCTTKKKVEKLKNETAKDSSLKHLIKLATNGWPKYKKDVPDEVKPYWHCKEEIHHKEGIVFRGNRVVIPRTLVKEILINVIHSAHQGIVACKNKGRESFYWPCMMKEIEDMIAKCAICQEHGRSNTNEPMIMHEVPKLPWQKIGVDFMKVKGNDYVLVTDYHSKFVEVRPLVTKTCEQTMGALKSIFRSHGIPEVLMSDNGPPFNSMEFKNFSGKYEFVHDTSSPKYPRSNGMIERHIQTVKNTIIKAILSSSDPNLSIMEYNNTPKGEVPAPAVLLMGRRLKTPTMFTNELRKPVFDTIKNWKKMKEKQERKDCKGRHLRPLEINQPVFIQQDHRKWTPATVIAKHQSPRSYIVKTPDGKQFRRNRIHLKERCDEDGGENHSSNAEAEVTDPSSILTDCDGNMSDKSEWKTDENQFKNRTPEYKRDPESSYITRSGREVRKPLRYRQ